MARTRGARRCVGGAGKKRPLELTPLDTTAPLPVPVSRSDAPPRPPAVPLDAARSAAILSRGLEVYPVEPDYAAIAAAAPLPSSSFGVPTLGALAAPGLAAIAAWRTAVRAAGALTSPAVLPLRDYIETTDMSADAVDWQRNNQLARETGTRPSGTQAVDSAVLKLAAVAPPPAALGDMLTLFRGVRWDDLAGPLAVASQAVVRECAPMSTTLDPGVALQFAMPGGMFMPRRVFTWRGENTLAVLVNRLDAGITLPLAAAWRAAARNAAPGETWMRVMALRAQVPDVVARVPALVASTLAALDGVPVAVAAVAASELGAPAVVERVQASLRAGLMKALDALGYVAPSQAEQRLTMLTYAYDWPINVNMQDPVYIATTPLFEFSDTLYGAIAGPELAPAGKRAMLVLRVPRAYPAAFIAGLDAYAQPVHVLRDAVSKVSGADWRGMDRNALARFAYDRGITPYAYQAEVLLHSGAVLHRTSAPVVDVVVPSPMNATSETKLDDGSKVTRRITLMLRVPVLEFAVDAAPAPCSGEEAPPSNEAAKRSRSEAPAATGGARHSRRRQRQRQRQRHRSHSRA